MQLTAAQLASLVQGNIHGNADQPVRAARSLQEAESTDITFIEHERNVRLVRDTRAGVLVVPPGAVPRLRDQLDRLTLLEVPDPLLAFVRIVQHLSDQPSAPPPGIDPRAAVDPTAVLGPGCSVMPFAFVGPRAVLGARCQIHPGAVVGENCRLGDDVVLHPGAILYRGCVLGHRVIVHANTVLGADGFGYRFQNGRHVKVPQLGHVEIGDDVEIGACATIDRGTFQATRVGAGTKIDNLVMIAHNCRIGTHNLLVSQVGIAGSCHTGEFVILAGQVGVADHVTIHDRAVIGAGSGVPSDIPAGQRVLGYPCWPERDARRIYASLTTLPALVRRVRQLEQKFDVSPSRNGESNGLGNGE